MQQEKDKVGVNSQRLFTEPNDKQHSVRKRRRNNNDAEVVVVDDSGVTVFQGGCYMTLSAFLCFFSTCCPALYLLNLAKDVSCFIGFTAACVGATSTAAGIEMCGQKKTSKEDKGAEEGASDQDKPNENTPLLIN